MIADDAQVWYNGHQIAETRAMKNRVYVAQEARHLDYTDAERFGAVVFCTNLEYSNIPRSLNNQQLTKQVSMTLGRFDPETDFLLLSGNPITMGFAFHEAYRRCLEAGKPLHLLRWDGVDRCYQPVQFFTDQ